MRGTKGEGSEARFALRGKESRLCTPGLAVVGVKCHQVPDDSFPVSGPMFPQSHLGASGSFQVFWAQRPENWCTDMELL